MNNLKTFIFLLLSFSIITSCGDDSDMCSADDVVGTYEGTATCTSGTDSGTRSDTYVITKDGDQLVLRDSNGSITTFDFMGCILDAPETSFDLLGTEIIASGNGEFRDNTLDVEVTVTVDGESITCSFLGTKL